MYYYCIALHEILIFWGAYLFKSAIVSRCIIYNVHVVQQYTNTSYSMYNGHATYVSGPRLKIRHKKCFVRKPPTQIFQLTG